LKKTSLGPLRQGQRLDTSETRPCSSKEHKPPKHTRAPPAHMQAPLNKCQLWAQTGQAGSTKTGQTCSQNRSGRFHTANHTPKSRKCQRNAHAPLDSWSRFQGCNAAFPHLPFSPLLPMHESTLKFENMQPRASQVYKIYHKMLHMSK
jgi:hypothetical protein